MIRRGLGWIAIMQTAVWPIAPVALAAEPIVTDGRTATSISSGGNTIDVHTKSVYGNNAYNSFKTFGVGAGGTVNLHVPGAASNLINLVREKRTDIDGTLNGVKNGTIGGNVYILSPNGISVGAGGTVNAGSLSLQTPTSQFLDSVLDATGTPQKGAVDRILSGTAPIAPDGQISIHGQINAIDSIHARGGGVNVSGALRAGSAGIAAMRSSVNLGGMRPAANTAYRTRSGAIVIGSPGNVRISGRLDASGEANVRGGRVDVRADGDIDVKNGAVISARGVGGNSDGGDIVVYAGGAARLESGALIDARGGDTGQGGFIEFSARKLVSLEGGQLVASSSDGKSGIIYIDPATVLYASDTVLDAASAVVEADTSIVLQAGITVSTQNPSFALVMRAPSIILNAGSKISTVQGANAGDITLETLVRNGASLDVPLAASIVVDRATIEGRNITLRATSSNQGGFGDKAASSTISLTGATITGANVTIHADATAESTYLGNFDPLNGENQTPLAIVQSVGAIALSSGFGGMPIKAAVGIARTDAVVDVGSGTTITASGAVSLDTVSTAKVNSPVYVDAATTPGGTQALPSLSAVYASTRAKASTNVAAGATINSGGALSVRSATDGSLKGENTSTISSSIVLGFTIAEGKADSVAQIAKGATINLSTPSAVTIDASNTGTYGAKTAMTATTKGDNAAFAGSWISVDETVHATLGATVTNAQSVSVTARSNVKELSGSVTSGNSEPSKVKRLLNALSGLDVNDLDADKAYEFFANRIANTLSRLVSPLHLTKPIDLPLQFSGTLSLIDADFDLSAKITAAQTTTVGTKPAGNPGSPVGDVVVDSQLILEKIQNSANGGTTIKDDSATAVALAVPVTNILIANEASIAAGSRVTASEKLAVTAKSEFKYDPQFTPTLNDPIGLISDFRLNGLEGTFLTSGSFGNAVQDATGANKTLGLAANIDLFNVDGATTARIGERDASATAPASATNVSAKSIVVDALSHIETMHASGTIGEIVKLEKLIDGKNPVLNPSGVGGTVGVGASYQGIVYRLATVAEIADRVTTTAVNGVAVNANTESALITIGASAMASSQSSAEVGAIGSVLVNTISTATLARIGKGSTVTSSGAGSDVTVNANDLAENINIVGGVVKASNLAFGASIGLNVIELDTKATIDGATRVSSGRDIKVEATSDGVAHSYALAGAISSTKPQPPASTTTQSLDGAADDLSTSNLAGTSATDKGAVAAVGDNSGNDSGKAGSAAGSGSSSIATALSAATGKYGVTVAGDAAVNVIRLGTKAEIQNAGTIQARDVVVAATSDFDVFGGAGAFSIQSFQDPTKPKTGQIGIAGAYSHNAFERNRIEAIVSGVSTLSATRDILISANNRQSIVSGAASGSGQAKPAGSGGTSAAIAGAVTFNTFKDAVTSAELIGSTVPTVRNLSVIALDDSSIKTGAGAATIRLGSGGLGIGASGSANISDADVKARIDTTTVTTSSSVTANARAARDILSIAVAVAGQAGSGKGVTLAGSFAYNSIGGSVLGEISGSNIKSNGAASVLASETSDVTTVSGEAAIGGKVGAGIAVAANALLGNAYAHVTTTTINAQSLSVRATTDRDSIGIAAGLAVGTGGAALNGSVVVNISGNEDTSDRRKGTIAEIDGTGNITVTGALDVGAADQTSLQSYAGALGGSFGSGGMGLGASVAINKADGEVTARMADVTVLRAGTVAVRAVTGANSVTNTSSRSQIIGVAASLAAGQTAALAAALVLNSLETRTTAEVTSTARLGSSTNRVGGVTVRADDRSLVGTGAMGISAGGQVALAGAVAIDLLKKTTTARLAGNTFSSQDVVVDARSSQAAYGGLLALGLSTQGNLAAAAAIADQSNTTLAEIGDSSTTAKNNAATTVDTTNNVSVNAEDKSDIIRFSGSAILASVQSQKSATTARIGTNDNVIALGQGADMQVRTGNLTGGIAPADDAATTGDQKSAATDLNSVKSGTSGQIETNIRAKNTQDSNSNTNSGAESVDATAILGAQTAATEARRGVSVTANSDQRMINLGLGGSIGSTAGVAGAATVSMIKGNTTAEIGTNARVNQSGAANANQDVVVRSKTNGLTIDVAVGAAAGGTAGVGAGVDVVLLEKTTTAKIASGARVSASRSIIVDADNKDQVVSVTASLGAGGTVGVSGAVGIATLANTAEAIVDSAASAASGARLAAGTDIVIHAHNRSDLFHIAGTLAIGGAAGLGAGVSIVNTKTRTAATLGNFAVADAVNDILVSADADTRMKSVTIAAAGGGKVGLAGAISVKSQETDTQAAIGNNARINDNGSGTGRNVAVSANDEASILSVVGSGAAGGAAGLSAGVDVITLKGKSSASIGLGATVRATQDVLVDSRLQKSLEGYTVAAGIGGAAGVAGAVSVIKAGGKLTTDQGNTLGTGGGVSGEVAKLTSTDNVISGAGFGNVDGAANAKSDANSAQSKANVSSNLAVGTQTSGNDATATIGDNARIFAGNDVTVRAANATVVDVLTGGVGVGGLAGFGAGIAIVDVNTLVTARIGANAEVNAGGNVSVTATDGNEQATGSRVKSFAGAGAVFVALGAAIAKFDFTTNTKAEIGRGAKVTVTVDADPADGNDTGRLMVSANELNNATAEAYGATLSIGGAAIGIQQAAITKKGSVTANVGDAGAAGSSPSLVTGLDAGVIDISARHGGSVTGEVYGATVGLVGAFSSIKIDLLDNVGAATRIGDYAKLKAAESILVETVSAPSVSGTSKGGVAAGLAAVGSSEVNSAAILSSLVNTGTGVTFESPGSVRILAKASRPASGDNVASSVTAGSGALLGGVTAIDSQTTLASNVATLIGNQNTFTVGQANDDKVGLLEIGTSSDVTTNTRAFGVAVGALAVGAVKSKSTVSTMSQVGFGSGTGGQIEGGLNIIATGAEHLDTATVGGAGGLIAGASATADNVLNSVVKTTFADNGTLAGFKAGAITLAARHLDGNVLANSDARSGYLVGKTGAYANNIVGNTVLVDIGDKVSLASVGEMLIEAANLTTKSNTGDTVYVASGGVAGGAATKSTTQFNNKVDVTIGAADIRVLDDENFLTTTDMVIRAYSNTVASDVARLDTGGAVAIAKAESHIKSGTSTDRDRTRVTIGDGAVIWNDEGDISIGARTDASLNASANAKTYGLAGAAEGISEARIFADNSVEIGKNARIYAEESIAIRAGADDRAGNAVSTIARTDLYNRTVIPVENDPTADAESNIGNTISAASGSRVNAVRNIELTANSGGVNADGFGRAKDLYQEALAAIGSFFSGLFGGGPVTLEDTYRNSKVASSADINLTNAEIRAGFKNTQVLDIAKNPVNMVSPFPEDEGATIRMYVPTQVNGQPIQSEGITYDVQNDISLETTLNQAITQLQAKINTFTGDTATKLALQNDLAVLQDRYNKLIAGATVTVDGTTLPSLANVLVDYIIVGNVVARSGDVNITANKLNGSGSITAPGDTKIEIVNRSAAFLQIGDLTIPEEEGGRIFFNGALVDSKAKLDSLNQGSSSVTLKSTANSTPVVSVTNTFGLAPGETRAADLVSVGNIYNPSGQITLTSQGNLDVSGTVRGATLSLSAGKDFTSSFTYGFFHVGGLPRQQFKSLATPNETKTYTSNSASASSSLTNFNFTTGSSIVAAGDVFISAQRVNVNGVIQSGIAQQRVTIAASKANDITQIDEAYSLYLANQSVDWNSRPNAIFVTFFGSRVCFLNCQTLRELTINSFKSQSKLVAASAIAKLIDSAGQETRFELAAARNVFVQGTIGAADVNQAANRVEREIGASYNAISKEIEVNNAVADGGRVQIFGELLSTGGGQINVLDGFAQIDISNGTSTPVVLGAISTGGTFKATETGDVAAGRVGRVRLIDPRYLVNDPTGKTDGTGAPLKIAKVVDYVRQNGTVVAFDNVTVDAAGNPNHSIAVSNATSRSASVTPTPSSPGYGWTTGQTELDVTETTYRKRVGQAFGIDLGKIGDLLASDPANIYSGPTRTVVGTPKPILVPIDTNGDGVNDAFGEVEYMTSNATGGYTFAFRRVDLAGTEVTTRTTTNWCSKSGWILGCFERTYQTVETVNGSNELFYRHSVPATQKIGLAFLGYDQGTVNVSSAGNIFLSGSIANTKGTTTITSGAGSILQRSADAVTTADVLNINATAGRVGGQGAVGRLGIDLMETATSKVKVVSGQGIDIEERRGTLRFDSLSAFAGDTNVVSSGGILQTNAAGVIRGNNISLTAKAGGIGTDTSTVRIDTGASGILNASGSGTINLTEISGDLNVDKIATGGDVKVTVVNGNLIDANKSDFRDKTTEAELLKIWQDSALIDDPANPGLDPTAARASRDASLAATTEKAKDDYEFYWSTRTAAGGTYDAGFAFQFSAADKTEMQKNGLSAADIASIEQERTAVFHEMHKLVGSTTHSATFSPAKVVIAHFEKDGKVVSPNEPGAVKVFSAVDISGAATGYAWSLVDLKASISKALVSERSSTNTIKEEANIEGNNITIDVQNGQIGRTIGEMTITAKPTGLTDDERIALAAAERDDITFLPDDVNPTSIVVAQRDDVDIIAKGAVDIRAKDHIFLGSDNTDINIVRAKSDVRDIRIKTGGAIGNAAAPGATAVEGRNLILEAPNGIGAQAAPLTTNLTGNLTARASGGDVHIANTGNLGVDFVFAGNLASLRSVNGSIFDGRNDTDVNVLAGFVALDGRTGIGTSANPLDIKVTGANGTVTFQSATGAIFIDATDLDLRVASSSAERSINLVARSGNVEVQDGASVVSRLDTISLTASDSIRLGRLTAQREIRANAVNGGISQADGDLASASGKVLLSATRDIVLAGVKSSAGVTGAVTIASSAGAILDGGDAHAEIDATAAGATIVLTAANGIGNGNALEINGNLIELTNTASGSIDIASGTSLTLAKVSQTGTGPVTVGSAGSLTVTSLVNVAGNLDLTSAGALSVNRSLTGASVNLASGGNMTVGPSAASTATVTATSGTVTANAGGTYTQFGAVNGATGVDVSSSQAGAISGNVTSTSGPVTLASRNSSLTAGGTVTAQGVVGLSAATNVTARNAVTSNAGTVTVTAGGQYDQTGNVSGATGVTVTSTQASDIKGAVTSGSGPVTLTSTASSVSVSGPVTAQGNVGLDAATNVTAGSPVTSNGGMVTVTAGGSYDQTGDVSGNSGVSVTTTGSTSILGSLLSSVGTAILKVAGTLGIGGDVTAAAGVNATSGGTATIDGNMQSSAGGIAVKSSQDIDVGGTVTAAGPVSMDASGAIAVGGRVESVSNSVTVTAGTTYEQTGGIAGAAGVSVTSGTSTDIKGSVVSTGGGVTIGTGTDLTLNGSLDAQTASLHANQDVFLIASPVVTSGALQVQADRNARIDGNISSTSGAISLRAGSFLDLAGTVTSPQVVSVRSAGNLAANAAVSASGTGTIDVQSGGTLGFKGSAVSSGGAIAMASASDATVDGLVASSGGRMDLTGGNNLTLSPSTRLVSNGGTITLTADGGATAAGTLLQAAGTGEINAGNGELVLRAANISLGNPITAGQFAISGGTGSGSVALANISVSASLIVEAARISIGNVTHTGTSAPLTVRASAVGGGMADLVELGITSSVGAQFSLLSTVNAMIAADTPMLELLDARIGARATLSNAEFDALVDNTTTRLQPTDLQLFQTVAGSSFYLLMSDRSFSTEVDVLNFDRGFVVRQFLPQQPLSAVSDAVTSDSGVVLRTDTMPLTDSVEEQRHIQLERQTGPSIDKAPSLTGTSVNLCERSKAVNIGRLAECRN